LTPHQYECGRREAQRIVWLNAEQKPSSYPRNKVYADHSGDHANNMASRDLGPHFDTSDQVDPAGNCADIQAGMKVW
jgi:hypothetical protein